MRINTNVASLNTQRILNQTSDDATKIMGRLSSGFRINHASDDAAGLGIANKMRADVRSLQQASRNADQANSLLQIAEGATSTVAGILDRMKELATQAASDSAGPDSGTAKTQINAEYGKLEDELQRIVDTTKFQGQDLLKGTFGKTNTLAGAVQASGAYLAAGLESVKATGAISATSFTVSMVTGSDTMTLTDNAGNAQTLKYSTAGSAQDLNFSALGVTLRLNGSFGEAALNTALTATPGTTDQITVSTTSTGGSFMVSSSGAYTGNDLITLDQVNLNRSKLGESVGGIGTGLTGIDLTTSAGARTALGVLDAAIDDVSKALGSIGAAQNRVDFANQNVKSTIQNTQAAESTIRDADMAQEMSSFSKTQILQQAGVAMLAQANQAPQMVLKLLG